MVYLVVLVGRGLPHKCVRRVAATTSQHTLLCLVGHDSYLGDALNNAMGTAITPEKRKKNLTEDASVDLY